MIQPFLDLITLPYFIYSMIGLSKITNNTSNVNTWLFNNGVFMIIFISLEHCISFIICCKLCYLKSKDSKDNLKSTYSIIMPVLLSMAFATVGTWLSYTGYNIIQTDCVSDCELYNTYMRPLTYFLITLVTLMYLIMLCSCGFLPLLCVKEQENNVSKLRSKQ